MANAQTKAAASATASPNDEAPALVNDKKAAGGKLSTIPTTIVTNLPVIEVSCYKCPVLPWRQSIEPRSFANFLALLLNS